ncbi:MAG TPA: hypothetical protein VFW45_11695 [Candidatus Polarisedimenticolia bacterium]|nr:hypothetical protein [Candidatus Polarisedimenticolia bacterium]
MLYHVSEESGIPRFEPRSSTYATEPVVWAIEEARLCNYLLPRDCPRVTFYAGPDTDSGDVRRYLGSSRAVVAIESDWLERAASTRLYRYRMPPETFTCLDECAGYFVSRTAIVPAGVVAIDGALQELGKSGADLRILPNLWALRDAVFSSTLRFSFIRMRNASPRPAA